MLNESYQKSDKLEMVVCEDCGREVLEDRIFVCSSCDGEFCKSCMGNTNKDMLCKECEVYVGKYAKYLREDW